MGLKATSASTKPVREQRLPTCGYDLISTDTLERISQTWLGCSFTELRHLVWRDLIGRTPIASGAIGLALSLMSQGQTTIIVLPLWMR